MVGQAPLAETRQSPGFGAAGGNSPSVSRWGYYDAESARRDEAEVDHDRLGRYQAQMAPGTPFREGLDRILAGRTGALIAIGDTEEVAHVSTGGFHLDASFTPTGLRELSKMDGGLVVTADLSRIVRAGVHFTPDSSIETVETGTRHASADRLAKQTGIPYGGIYDSWNKIWLEGPFRTVMSDGSDIAADVEKAAERRDEL